MTRDGEFLLVGMEWQLSNSPVVRLTVSLLLITSLLAFGQEAPKRGEVSRERPMRVATVDIQKLFRGYRKTLTAEREIDLARAEIQRTSQLATNEIQTRRRIAEERIYKVRKGNASEEEIAELQRELPLLTRELKIAEQEKRNERDAANRELNEQMARRMTGILKEIVELTAKKADSEGLDMVIDISGANSNQVPPMLFAKDAIDFTPLMAKELGNSSDEKR